MTFEPKTLYDFSDEALLQEIRRVIPQFPAGSVSKRAFTAKSRVSADTLIKKFGGWKEALIAAGFGDRYGGPSKITEKMRTPCYLTDAEMIAELKRVATVRGTSELSISDFINSSSVDPAPIRKRFGGWKHALEKAGLGAPLLSRRYSNEECFDNLLNVWTHYGRQPTSDEMRKAPSKVGIKAYKTRWGTWRKAMQAFIAYVNSDTTPQQPGDICPDDTAGPYSEEPQTDSRRQPDEDRHQIKIGLRYKVLNRDRFRCVICGRSPATDLNVKLHVDHIYPWSKGGKTTLENLRSTCHECNLGKGSTIESQQAHAPDSS